MCPFGRSLRSPCYAPKVSTFLLKMIVASCLLNSVGAAAATGPTAPAPSPTCGCYSDEFSSIREELAAMKRMQEASDRKQKDFYEFMHKIRTPPKSYYPRIFPEADV